jgi:hypothetical protein
MSLKRAILVVPHGHPLLRFQGDRGFTRHPTGHPTHIDPPGCATGPAKVVSTKQTMVTKESKKVGRRFAKIYFLQASDLGQLGSL